MLLISDATLLIAKMEESKEGIVFDYANDFLH